MGSSLLRLLKRWLDSHEETGLASREDGRDMDRARTIRFIMLHVAVFTVFWVGWSPVAVTAAVVLYVVRMFAITGFYHRYFSHRSFRTSRWMQLVFACIGATAVQRGPLWWAANHRVHHSHSDQPADVHSPIHYGLWWSHMGWFLTHDQLSTKLKRIKDFARYPELRFLDRFDLLVPLILALSLFFFGEWIDGAYPHLGTNGWQMLIWGFVISTVALWHGTFTINSLSHRFGSRRYATSDNSRNNLLLAILTLGEGWHNNHHQYPSSARQGFRWWEIDITYYLLQGLQLCGLIRDIRPVPAWVLNQPDQSSQETNSEKIAI
jgi:stearoyl-CoA desaturase (delta-9 desaturase)